MATLILAAVGSNATIFGGVFGVGTFAGAALTAAGAVIDNATILRPPDQRGPRLDDLAISSGAEGQPMWYCLGQENRIPGQIIWSSPKRETVHEQGKGGPDIETYTYSIDVAISFGEGPIDGIDKIWLNGKLFYDDTPNISLVSNQLSVTLRREYFQSGGVQVHARSFEDITSPNGGPDLSVFRSGVNITVSGFAQANNNGTYKCASATKDDATGISTLSLERAFNFEPVNESAGQTVTLAQSPPKWSSRQAANVTVYTGTPTQLPDPLIESYPGMAGKTPAYRGECYVVVQGLQLKDFGNQAPVAISGMVRETATPRLLGDAIAKLLVRAGRSPTEFDVSAINGITLKGYALRGPISMKAALEPLMVAFDLITQEDQGVLRFLPRASSAVVTVDDALFVRPENGESRQVLFKDAPSVSLPNEVNVNYINPAADYQTGSERERKADFLPPADAVLTLDIPITMTTSDARQLARKVLWSMHANRWTVSMSLPPSQMEIIENDRIRTNVQGVDFDFLVQKVDLGANGVLEIEAVTEEIQTLTQSGVAETGASESGGSDIFIPPDTVFAPMSIGPLTDDMVNTPGFPWAGAQSDPTELFYSAALYESRDAGSTYLNVESMFAEATMGYATTALATGILGVFDVRSTVTVRLVQGELENCTETECLNGKNRALIGGEVIGFTTATLTGTRTYVLSGLIRGLVNTENFRTHLAGEVFVLFAENTINFHALSQSDFGSTLSYKLLAQGGQLANYLKYDFQAVHGTLRQFPPADIRGTRNISNNDILVSWQARTRTPNFRIFGTQAAPLNDTAESYKIEILGGSPPGSVGAVFGTYTVSGIGTRTFNYTAAQQSADGFGTPGALRYCQISAISSLVGAGYPSTVVVI